jgi:phenylacetic acid degradation operon negative regulatory protein
MNSKPIDTIVNNILAILMSNHSSKRYRSILDSLETGHFSKGSIRVSLYRLQSKGLIQKSDSEWEITDEGRKYFKHKHRLTYLPSPFTSTYSKNTIISFDIPERDRAIRNWLRHQIKIYGFKKLQQSLWVGPGPLPKNFLLRLKELNIKNNIKIFKVLKSN